MVSLVTGTPAMGPPLYVPQKKVLKRDSSHLDTSNISKTLKRDASHLDPSSSSPPPPDTITSSQNKRLKVAFDDNVHVRIMEDWSSKPLDLVREEVRSAIDGHHRTADDKDDTAYEQLRMVFVGAQSDLGQDGQSRDVHDSSSDKPATSLLSKYMAVLLGRVSDLKGCANLVVAILDVNWIGRDDSFAALYVRFLGALAIAVPGFMRTILDRIVRHFVALPAALGRIPGEPRIARHQMVPRLHNALRYLLRLIPSASSALVESLRAAFPNHHSATRQSYVGFVKNALRVIEYTPELKAEVLTLITERVVKIDVEVQEEIDELDDDIEDKLVLGAKEVSHAVAEAEDSDADAYDSDNDSVTSSELSMTPEEMHIRALRDTVGKLDAVLDLLFQHYTPIFAHGKSFEVNDAFEHLISQFATFVLPTYRSRHTQFLVFHFAQVSQSFSERFAAVLVQMALGRGVAPHGAMSAAAYLASFISRGARISKSLIRQIFLLLANHLDQMRRVADPTCRGPELRRYTGFYATAQAMLYIFCFRWRDFIVSSSSLTSSSIDDLADEDAYDLLEDGDANWLPGVKEILTQAIYSKLNPLKVCSPAIVAQFAAIANHLRFMYVIPLLETNKRLRLSSYRSISSLSTSSSASGVGGVGGGMGGGGSNADMGAGKRENSLSNRLGEAHLRLDAFFPFDPYQLPKSRRWLVGDYLEWRGVPGMRGEEEDEDEDDEGSESGSGSEGEGGSGDEEGDEDEEEGVVGQGDLVSVSS